MYHILDQYFEQPGKHALMPVAVDVITPGDFHVYLVAYGADDWYVIVEADFLVGGLLGITSDIEATFPVRVAGWCVLKQYQQEAGRNLLPPDSDTDDPDGTNDNNHNNYVHTVHSEYGMRYVLALVKPEPGVGVEDFGLSYFTEEQTP